MKREYMVTMHLPETFSAQFINLIPQQRMHVDELLTEGTLTSYALALDRSKVWVSMKAESYEKVMDILSEFPIFSYIRVELSELVFRNTSSLVFPEINLN
jgi:hypothetical protein